MSTFVQDSISKQKSISYTGMTTDSIRTDIDNKKIQVFDSEGNLVENKVDDVISEKELEAYNRLEAEEKEKRKQTLKAVGLAAFGVAAIVGGLLTKKLCSNSKILKEINKNPMEDAGKFIRENLNVSVEGSELKIYDKNAWGGSRIFSCKNSRKAKRTAIKLFKSKKDSEVVRIKNNKVVVNTYNRMQQLKSIQYKTPEEAKQAAENLLNLNEPWVMYRKNANIIIEANEGELIDLSKIDSLIGGTRIAVRYNSKKEAMQAVKKLLMKQFEKPLSQQVECAVTVEGRNVTGIAYGTSCRSDVYKPIFYGSVPEIYHNHPCSGLVDMPLSYIEEGDIGLLLSRNFKSITAYNHLGQYNTAEITNFDKFRKDNDELCDKVMNEIRIYEMEGCVGKDKARLFVDIENRYDNYIENNLKVPEELEKQYESLSKEINQSPLPWNSMREYAQWQHKVLKKVLPKNGIKYMTNYSSLANI